MSETRRTARFLRLLPRSLLAILLLLAGAGKLIDGEAAAQVFRLLVDQDPALAPAAPAVVYAVSFIEIVLAGWLLWGRGLRGGLGATAGLIVAFTLALVSLPLRGIEVPACGCFGALLPEGSLGTALVRNSGLLLLTMAAAVLAAEEKTEPA